MLAAATLVRFLDREVVDTYVRGAGTAPRLLGAAVRRAQTGNVQTYLERAARRLASSCLPPSSSPSER